MHASHVESTLLSQVRVVKVGQEINVWVMGRTRVRLTVGGPPIKTYNWSISAQRTPSVRLETSSKADIAILTTDTELSIAPKTHRRLKDVSHDISSKEDSAEKLSDPPETVLRVLPTRLLDDVSCNGSAYTGTVTLAYVHPYTLSVLADSSYPLKEDMNDAFVNSLYRYLQPPQDPLEISFSGANTGPSDPPSQSNFNADGSRGEKSGDWSPDNALVIGCSRKVLESHIYFPNGLKGADNWHWIQ